MPLKLVGALRPELKLCAVWMSYLYSRSYSFLQKIEAYLVFIECFRFLNKIFFLHDTKKIHETTSILVRQKFIFTLLRHPQFKRLPLLEKMI